MPQQASPPAGPMVSPGSANVPRRIAAPSQPGPVPSRSAQKDADSRTLPSRMRGAGLFARVRLAGGGEHSVSWARSGGCARVLRASCMPWAQRSADHGPEMADWAHRLQVSPAAVLPAAGEPLDYGQDRCERVDDVLQRVSYLLQLVAVRALAAKSMAEHDKVGACIFERTGGVSAVFHCRWDTFVSMAVRVEGAAGHAGRPWLAVAAVLGGPDSLMPGQELRAIRSSSGI